MIQFNTLKFITPKILEVEAQVKDLSYYDNVYINSISIDTEDTVNATVPSDNVVYKKTFDEVAKTVHLTVDVSTLTDCPCDAQMFFVFAEAIGTPSPDTPCGMDNIYTMGIAVDLKKVYKVAMHYMKDLSEKCGCTDPSCSVSPQLANFALEYYRLKEAVEFNDLDTLMDSFNHLVGRDIVSTRILSVPTSNCGCNGN